MIMRSRHPNRGYIILFALIVSAVVMTVTAAFFNYYGSGVRAMRAALVGAQAQALAEAGIDNAVYELNQNGSYTGESNTALGGGVFTVSVATVDSSTKRITATGFVPDSANPTATKKVVQASASIDTEVVSFAFGVQAGNGGIFLENNASVRGNVYSNGPVTGQNSNIVRGAVVSAGPSGLISGVHATSSGYAHTIQNSTLDGDAYFQSISNTTVAGVQYPGSADQATTSLPIPDALIEEWKTAALAGGTHTSPCPYEISTSVTIGPTKIDCDLTIKGNGITVTLAGPLWVKGNLSIENSPTIRVGASQSGRSVPIVVDNPSNRSTGSTAELENSAVFEGSGDNSHILLVSQNNSAENGGTTVAIDVKNTVSGDLLVYAGHGEIVLQNNINLREVTAWRIRAKNFAEIVYKTGLGDTLFSSGPGGSWAVVPGTYAIVR